MGQNLGQAIAGGLATVVPDAAARVGAAGARQVFRGKPGVTPEQEAALDRTPGTQGELPDRRGRTRRLGTERRGAAVAFTGYHGSWPSASG